MKALSRWCALILVILIFHSSPVSPQQSRQTLVRHVPLAVTAGLAKPIGPLPSTRRLNLSIVLPLRNQDQLTSLLSGLYDPSNPDYRHFLSAADFRDRFAPTADDCQAVVAFARSHGFMVQAVSANRMVVPIVGTVEQVQSAFNVKMQMYQHPTENRVFFSPDREPSVVLGIKIAHVVGLDSYSIPKPMHVKPNSDQVGSVSSVLGSGPGGAYLGSDMRAAYYGGSELTGAGQTVALVQFDGYDINDVVADFGGAATATSGGTDYSISYTPSAGGSSYSIPVHNVLLDGATGAPGQFLPPADDAEQSLDVAQAIGMAPGLDQVRVYIAPPGYDADILSAIASENVAKLVSISWTWGTVDPGIDDMFFQELAAQGQSVFVASGDDGSYNPLLGMFYPAEDDYVTSVGGTTLTTSGPGGSWTAESAWDRSGGGVSLTNNPIPDWQVLAINGTNGGSTTLRNVPDVAMEGGFDNYACSMGICQGGYAGTSFAAPRWTGFMALADQQAAASGNAPVGFANPALYTIGEGSSYDGTFHDIVNGNNNYFELPPLPYFFAVPGYDLVTGWGSPVGQSLIDALAPQVSPGFQLASSVGTLTVKSGNQGTAVISIGEQGGFNGKVTLAVSGLPAGVSASFSANPVAGSSVLTVSVSDSAVRGVYLVTVLGISGAKSATTSFDLNVDGPGFSILFSPSNLVIAQGGIATTTATVVRYGGFSGDVSLAVTSPIPDGLTTSWSTNPTSGTSELSLTTTSATYASILTVTGTSGKLSATAPLGLDMMLPEFAIDIAPIPSTLAQGASTTATVTLIPNGNLTSAVSLFAFGMPSGVTATLNPTFLNANQTSVLSLTASASAQLGVSEICIIGSVQAYVTQTGQFFIETITNSPASTFTLAVSQPTPTLAQGASVSETITVSPQAGFIGAVNFTVTGLPSGVTASISPNPATGNSVLTLRATSNAAPGLYQVDVFGNSGTQSTAAIIYLTVPATPSFSLSPSPASLTLVPGGTAHEAINVIPHFGFSGAVNLSVVSGLPIGVSASFSPDPGTGTSTLTLSAGSSASPGSYILNIAGNAGSETENSTTFLTVGSSTGSGTTTTLSVFPSPATSAPIGTLYRLTAKVISAAGPVTQGQVKFCDTSSPSCTDTHLLGTAQLTNTGTAVLQFHPPAGNHSYAAVYLGISSRTQPYPTSSSTPVILDILAPTSTVISATGTPGDYSVTAAVSGVASFSAPSGSVSFLDSSENNNPVGTATLENRSESLAFSILSNPATGNSPSSVAVGDFNGDGKLDIAAVNQQNNTVTILAGNGDGTFTVTQNAVATGETRSRLSQATSTMTGSWTLRLQTSLRILSASCLEMGMEPSLPLQVAPALAQCRIPLSRATSMGMEILTWPS